MFLFNTANFTFCLTLPQVMIHGITHFYFTIANTGACNQGSYPNECRMKLPHCKLLRSTQDQQIKTRGSALKKLKEMKKISVLLL